MYTFSIPWAEIDKKTIRDVLKTCKRKKTKAPHSVMKALKVAIVVKLADHWLAWRQDHPEVTRKSPGRDIYRDVTSQVKHGLSRTQYSSLEYLSYLMCLQ